MAAAVEYFLNIILLLVSTVCVGAVGRNIVRSWLGSNCHGLFAVCGGGGRWMAAMAAAGPAGSFPPKRVVEFNLKFPAKSARARARARP